MIGFIYIVYCDLNDDFYIGSTNSTIKVRWRKHKSKAKSGGTSKIYKAIREYGNDNFNIDILENVEYENEEYLKILENKYIEYFKPTLNKNKSYLTPCERLLKKRENSLRYYYAHVGDSEEFKMKMRERRMRYYYNNRECCLRKRKNDYLRKKSKII